MLLFAETSPINWVDRFGLPVALLLIIGFAAWRIIVYVANKIAEPLIARHAELLDSIQSKLKIDSNTMGKLADNQARQVENEHQQTALMEKVLALELDENQTLETIHSKVDRLIERSIKRRESREGD